ncbi:MBL fold metallo-hydrolase [Geobacillus sp. FSL K6-0789]|uniref:MBL fold metallo-hydrolase n=1 Tax=Geobacillus stearothermophilus TaxID=1422 RepID=A0A0K9HLZ0_GEOSE|nr:MULTISPECIES: MBL fold metallo-hydrolase [Geobacillus]KMY57435.1 metallohydrolase [Geobacillus stearothermophilus]KMY59891.1 metallohydrolase [Geobacillus stearothermophilus]KMY61272.1 metallohydrolase [Geobacillus stearothermophilus]KQC46404.1 metallohydrolase [Geobacillus sp. Sah69]KYD30769.1 hypothetical protein B4114_2958 [Geobacillus stearothermophilus]
MTMRFSVLASGSTGNAFYVETDRQRLLVDAGLSGRQLEQLFAEIGRHPKELDGLLVTHEHSDHIKGLGVLARKYRLPVYANEKTWRAMEQVVGDIPAEQKFVFPLGAVRTFGDVDVESFGVSHDAVEPMFYVFHYGGKKLALLTDTGYVSERIKKTIENADVFVFESNHDVGMLRMGRYPWSVKRRILSDVGHISNEEAGLALADVIGERTKQVYLAHLSQDNNMKELARMTVAQILEQRGLAVGARFHLYDTDPRRATALAYV